MDKIKRTKEEWSNALSSEQYSVCREGATEQPFSGKYYLHDEKGDYCCVCCNTILFSSETKYDSGSGWPSFWEAFDKKNIILREDLSHNKVRTEVCCAHCLSHLGHVFQDGPQPTGQRYCINSLALDFKSENES